MIGDRKGMLSLIKLLRRTVEGSLAAILLVAVAGIFGFSDTISLLLEERSVSSILFLIVLVIVLADIIAKLISILSTTFPDLLPKVDRDSLRLASLVNGVSPGKVFAFLAGTHLARVIVFLIVFALLGATYASAPNVVQERLVGDYSTMGAIEAFIRESLAGSVGYFLFFLGGDNLEPITSAIASERLTAQSIDGDIFLSGIRLYGLTFVLAILRMLATPVIVGRARLRARDLDDGNGAADDPRQRPAAEMG